MVTIFKPVDYNAVKAETNVGDAQAIDKVYNGFVGKIVRNHTVGGKTYEKAFVPLAAGDLNSDNIYVALFTPLAQDSHREETSSGTMTEVYKNAGDYVRLFQATRHNMLDFELSANLINTPYANINVGNTLIPSTDGSYKWVVGTTATKAALRVTAKDDIAGGVYFDGAGEGVKATLTAI